MGYIIKELKHNNKTLIALFDSGSVFTYVKESSLPKDTFFVPITPIKVRLAGEKHTINKMCSIEVSIDKYKFSFLAYPLKLIGKIVFNNKETDIDLLISVIVMEQWDRELLIKLVARDNNSIKEMLTDISNRFNDWKEI